MNEYYYLDTQKKPCGPHTADELRALLTLGQLTPDTLIAHKGANKWMPLSTLTAPAAPVPAPAPVPYVPNPVAGNCPKCGEQLTFANGRFPSRCPHCGFRLCADIPESLWSNFKLAFSKMFVLRGRAPRIEYWSYYLFSNIFNIVAQIVCTILMLVAAASAVSMESGGGGIVFMIIAYLLPYLITFVLAIPQMTASVRRLHDVGKSGWLVLLPLLFLVIAGASFAFGICNIPTTESEIAFIISIISIIAVFGMGIYLFILTLLDSQRGQNKYGPSSKYPLG